MIVIIPLAGLGKRFSDAGYTLPKALINVMGKPILYWLLNNITNTNVDFIYIPYNTELSKYRFEDRLIKDFPQFNFKFLKLSDNTRGAAETIKIALDILSVKDTPVLCLDSDNFYTCDIIKQWDQSNTLYVFEDTSNEEVFSYVSTDENFNIIDIKEKNKISNIACTGAYGFKSWKQLHKYCKVIIENNIMQKNEFYTSTVIHQMLKDNIKFNTNHIHNSNYICLGTPLHVRIFCNNFQRINALNNNTMFTSKRYCFDLDNTLVSFPKIKNDYTSVQPINKNINFLRYLKKLGHTIIIYTARRMKTHSGNISKIMADIGKITFDTLTKFDIPYDEIVFGKPHADFYIDDLAISSYSDLEKELGFYESQIVPRDFNSINHTSIQLYKKTSDDLSGEIHYYNNIPLSVKDLFPLFITYFFTVITYI
jgi:capsule biosynthesis phosphatase